MIDNSKGIDSSEYTTVRVSDELGKLTFDISSQIVHLTGDDVEPLEESGSGMEGVYFNERPKETFVIYILNKIILDSLVSQYGKDIKGAHMHECLNTEGTMVCWPQKVDSVEDAKDVLKNWAGLIGAFLTSDKDDMNDLYIDGDINWVQTAIANAGINVNLQENNNK